MARLALTSDRSSGPVAGSGSAAVAVDVDLVKITSLAIYDAHMAVVRQQLKEQGLK